MSRGWLYCIPLTHSSERINMETHKTYCNSTKTFELWRKQTHFTSVCSDIVNVTSNYSLLVINHLEKQRKNWNEKRRVTYLCTLFSSQYLAASSSGISTSFFSKTQLTGIIGSPPCSCTLSIKQGNLRIYPYNITFNLHLKASKKHTI